jgi:hypothetical protein
MTDVGRSTAYHRQAGAMTDEYGVVIGRKRHA